VAGNRFGTAAVSKSTAGRVVISSFAFATATYLLAVYEKHLYGKNIPQSRVKFRNSFIVGADVIK